MTAFAGITLKPCPFCGRHPDTLARPDNIRVACITLDGSTLTVPVKNLADVVPDLISETGDVYTLTIKEMTVAEYEALGEFNGF